MHLYSYLQKKNVYVLSSFDCTVMSLHHLIRRFQHSFEVGPISHRRDAKFPRASSVLEWHHANISQLLRNDDAYRLKAVDISAEILRSRNQLLQKCCFFFLFLEVLCTGGYLWFASQIRFLLTIHLYAVSQDLSPTILPLYAQRNKCT